MVTIHYRHSFKFYVSRKLTIIHTFDLLSELSSEMSDYKPEDLKSKLESGLEGVEHCEVTDLSDGCGGKFNVVVVTPKFDGVALLARCLPIVLPSVANTLILSNKDTLVKILVKIEVSNHR